MWNPFKTNKSLIITEKSISPIEKKSSTLSVFGEWFVNGGGSGENNALTIKRALIFYDKAAPVATAIDWINDEFKTLGLVLRNDKSIQTTGQILDFLKHPNDDMTQEEFLEALGAYYLICNEVYLLATGNIDAIPAELYVISPEFINIQRDVDGLIARITLQQAGRGIQIFNRSEKGYRFINSDKTAEIWQIKGFSALNYSAFGSGVGGSSDLGSSRGRSKLSSIHKEINQYLEIATHNLSVLNNGMMPSGTIEVPENNTLDDDQFESLRAQVINFYSGSENAGKVLILDNGMKFNPVSSYAKDMDFKELTSQVSTTIYNRYKVPLPLVKSENMTLANMEVAKLNLYDNCVTPLANRLLRELTNFLGERFKLKPSDLIAANLDSIPALQTRRLQEITLLKALNLNTTNELRLMIGDAPVKDGDVVYQNYNLIPLGEKSTRSDLSQVDPDANNQIDKQPKKSKKIKKLKNYTSRKNFIDIMNQQINVDGTKKYTLEFIENIADTEGL